MINELLDKLSNSHPAIYAILILLMFACGCAAIWGLAMLAKFLGGTL